MIPAVAVPLSLVGTFAAMYFAGFSLNNQTLMALTISMGFVVDDAIVVRENIARHLDEGGTPLEAALTGSREVGFTVLSMSTLVAVFIPLLFMGGLVGRLFREFAVTLSVAVAVSLVISLTMTPMLRTRFLRIARETKRHRVSGRTGVWQRLLRASDNAFECLRAGYDRLCCPRSKRSKTTSPPNACWLRRRSDSRQQSPQLNVPSTSRSISTGPES